MAAEQIAPVKPHSGNFCRYCGFLYLEQQQRRLYHVYLRSMVCFSCGVPCDFLKKALHICRYWREPYTVFFANFSNIMHHFNNRCGLLCDFHLAGRLGPRQRVYRNIKQSFWISGNIRNCQSEISPTLRYGKANCPAIRQSDNQVAGYSKVA